MFAEHFARASDFQVVHREVKAASEVFEGLNRFEALGGLLCDRARRGRRR